MNKKNKNKNEQKPFAFCEVCRLNHNNGRRHNYFPSHKSSLSTLLTRFQSKLSDVKFFLKTPIPLRPEHAHQNRLWCVFCNRDILELDSRVACGNAIEHLASGEHWKRVKGFVWKYGGAMDRVDSFRITEVDYAKWEKKCKLLETEAARVESIGASNRMRELRRSIQYYLPFQRLALLSIMCLGAYKSEMHKQQVAWRIRISPILLLENAHLMVILVMELYTQE